MPTTLHSELADDGRWHNLEVRFREFTPLPSRMPGTKLDEENLNSK